MDRFRMTDSRVATIILLGAGLLSGISKASAADRPLLTDGRLQALVADDPGWCGQSIDVTLRGSSADDFRDEDGQLQRLVGALRAALSFECPPAEIIILSGYAGSAQVFAATTSAANGWTLDVQQGSGAAAQPFASNSRPESMPPAQSPPPVLSAPPMPTPASAEPSPPESSDVPTATEPATESSGNTLWIVLAVVGLAALGGIVWLRRQTGATVASTPAPGASAPGTAAVLATTIPAPASSAPSVTPVVAPPSAVEAPTNEQTPPEPVPDNAAKSEVPTIAASPPLAEPPGERIAPVDTAGRTDTISSTEAPVAPAAPEAADTPPPKSPTLARFDGSGP